MGADNPERCMQSARKRRVEVEAPAREREQVRPGCFRLFSLQALVGPEGPCHTPRIKGDNDQNIYGHPKDNVEHWHE